ncbi:lysophospholipase L1-like esterase [Scopulibacillus daqui]|uniref:Lysophospholipase L1-like esterase n=1 Tax=Scopulibacillus daqui TaxID=1469162 RepID=A0ABS2Q1J3_9BACL|nr:SGNH/GDSL hydrolase family protein [Scopulibacillus daqui]MBM7646168.1 lysophospholipase L1-like esterase [Scopulibacillus daqui]
MKIVCFGDSVTRGVSYIRGRLRIIKETYPSILQEYLGDQNEVLNKGVFNDNSDLLVKRLDKDVLSQKPDAVLIQIGGNDCNFHWDEVAKRPDDEHEPIVPLNRYLNNIKVMIDQIKEMGAVPILSTLLPLDPKRYYEHISRMNNKSIAHWIAACGGIEHWHGMYNRALKKIIKSNHVLSIDIRTAFKESNDLSVLLSDDGIHPSPEGYSVMAGIIKQGLRGL